MEALQPSEIKNAVFQCVQFKKQKVNEKIAERILPSVSQEVPDEK